MPSKTKGFVLFHLPSCQFRGNKHLRQVETRQCVLGNKRNGTEVTVDFERQLTIVSNSKVFWTYQTT